MKAPSRWTERFEYGGERGTSQELFLQIVILFTIRKLYDEALERKKCIDNCWLSCIHGADKAVAIFSRIKTNAIGSPKALSRSTQLSGVVGAVGQERASGAMLRLQRVYYYGASQRFSKS